MELILAEKTSLDPKIRLSYLLKKAMPNKNGCLEWFGNNVDGYSRITFNKRSWYGHRLVWFFINGPIPEGKVICHKCDNPRCINIDHLFIGSQLENLMDKISKGRCPIKSKTHCIRSHEFNKENTWITKQGRRKCKLCDKFYKMEKSNGTNS